MMNYFKPEEDEIIKEYFLTKSIKELCELLPGRSYDSIKSRKRSLGFVRKPATYNINFFQTPNLINCQIAGFISADGAISYNKEKPRLVINISNVDRNYLEQICKTIEYNGSIYCYTRENLIKNYRHPTGPPKRSVSTMCSIYVSNCPRWKDDLESNFSIVPNKTLVLQPPKLNNIDLVLAFISGNIDGDGSVILYKRNEGNLTTRLNISLLGTYDLLFWVKTWMNKIFPTYASSQVRPERAGSKIYNYVISGAEAYLFSKMVLSMPLLRLDRKWNNAREYIKIFESHEMSGDMKIKLGKLLNKDIVGYVYKYGGTFPDHILSIIKDKTISQ